MAIKDNLVSFWEFESGALLVDSHGTMTLTDNGTVTQNTGKVGMAAEFTAANTEFLSHTDHTDLEPGDANFTFTAWVYLVAGYGTYPFILSKDDGGTLRSYYLRYMGGATNRFDFGLYSDGTEGALVYANTFGAASNNTWYFVTVQYDADANLMYISVNAGTQDTNTQTGGAFSNALDFRIGYLNISDTNALWNGRIDQIVFWKRKITADEITWMFNGGDGRSYAALASTFPLTVQLRDNLNG